MVSPKASSRPGKRQAGSHMLEVAVATCVLSASAYWLMTHRSEVEGRLGRGVKAYTDFDTFYHNLYLKEHSVPENRYLHFLGTSLSLLFLLTEPRLLVCMPLAVAVGLNVFYSTLHVPHGALEMAAMGLAFVTAGRVLTGSYTKPAAALGVGYFWAWVGHFLVEHNRPATFTYGAFSLMGDLRMWVRTLAEIREAVTMPAN